MTEVEKDLEEYVKKYSIKHGITPEEATTYLHSGVSAGQDT